VASTCAFATTADAADLPTSIDLSPGHLAAAPSEVDYIEWVEEGEVENGASPMRPAGKSPVYQLRGVWRSVKAASGATDVDVHLTIDRIKLKSEGRGGPIEYDSDMIVEGTEKNRLQYVVDPALEQPFVLTVRPGDGRTSAVGMDDISMLIEEVAAGKFVFEAFMPDFTDDAAQFAWGDSRFAPYAYRTVSAGDEWSRNISYHHLSLGTLEYRYAMKLDRIEKRDGRSVAIVKYSGDIAKPENARSGVRVFNVASRFQSGKFGGHAVFDIDARQFVEQVTDHEMKVESSMLLGSVDKPFSFSQDFKTTTTVRVMSKSERERQRKAHMEAAKAAAEDAQKPESREPA
jgi:hypothetical protein